MRLALKTLTYGIAHVAVATAVAYALTGNLTASIGIGLIEPIIQTGVFTVHEILWEGRPGQRGRASSPGPAPAH
ncbi:MAG: DUF2061 domain-containing protein [Rhodospirillaceae bacterium]